MNASLPAKAASKLAMLGDRADDAAALALATTRRISDIERILGLNPGGSNAPEMKEELSRLRSSHSVQQKRRTERANLIAQLRGFLQHFPPNGRLETITPPRPKLKDGELLSAAISRLRNEIAAAKNHLAEVKSATLPKAELKKLARAQVQDLAARGRPKLNTTSSLTIAFSRLENVPGLDLGATLAWLDSDNLIKRLNDEIDALPDARLTLSTAEKAEREGGLTSQLDTLERAEESLIEAAAEEGLNIERRVDASPVAVLGVVIKMPASRAA